MDKATKIIFNALERFANTYKSEEPRTRSRTDRIVHDFLETVALEDERRIYRIYYDCIKHSQNI